MINWFNMPSEGLSNGGQFEIKELTATENRTYEKDGEVYNKVTVNVSGGGSSDFSTAEVTIITASGKNNIIMFPLIEDNTEYSMVGATFNNDVGSKTYTVPLYKGECDANIYGEEEINISVTGNAEYVEADGYIIITGDCTITVSALE